MLRVFAVITVVLVAICKATASAGFSPPADLEYDLKEVSRTSEPAEHVLFGMRSDGVPVPRVLFKKDRIEILDETGKVKDTLERTDNAAKRVETHLRPDPSGKVMGVQITRGYSPKRESWTKGEYFILDATGRKTLEINPFDVNTEPLPSPSGDYAIGWAEQMGPPLFYDATGIRNKWAHGFTGNGWPEFQKVGGVEFSPDGSRVAVYAYQGNNDTTIVYDDQGNKLFEKAGVRLALFSPDSQLLAFEANRTTIGVLDNGGSVLWEKPLNQRPTQFSSDGQLVLFTAGPLLALYNAKTGAQAWQWQPTDDQLAQIREGRRVESEGPLKGRPGFGLLAVTGTPSLDRIVGVGIGHRYQVLNPGHPQRRVVPTIAHLLVWDRNGKLLAWKTLPGDMIVSVSELALVPLAISSDGQTISLNGKDGLHTYSLLAKTK